MHLRRWPNIKSALVQRLVFAAVYNQKAVSAYFSFAFAKHWADNAAYPYLLQFEGGKLSL